MTTTKALSIIKRAGMLLYIAKAACDKVTDNPTMDNLHAAIKARKAADKIVEAHGLNAVELMSVFNDEDAGAKFTAWPLEYVALCGVPHEANVPDAHDIENDDAAQLDGDYND